MAKRFMDNSIFEKQWFRQLPIRLKVVWFYLINKCNHAGIWECDIDLLSFQIGDNYNLDEIIEAFGDNIQAIGDNKYFITKFIQFQYGLPLNPNVKVHQSVIKLLDKYNIDYDNTLVSVKDKDKDKKEDINIRMKKFAIRVEKEVSDMNVQSRELQDFISYWTEHNDGGKLLRFEMQDIFNVKRRMSTWIRNSKKFNTFQPTLEDINEKEEKLEREYQEQQKRLRKANENIATEEDRKEALGLN